MKFNYLKHVELPYIDENTIWSICPFTGSLLKEDASKYNRKIIVPNKVKRALECCDSPYSCKPNISSKLHLSQSKIDKLQRLNNIVLQIGNNHFYLTRLYSCIKNKLFQNTFESIIYINHLPENYNLRHQRCLQRAFLASKVSVSFDEKGVIFIGAFLPTGDMHAWIIEDGSQVDIDDSGWINYRPLLAFYH